MAAPVQRVAHVELHDDLRLGVAEENVPGQFALHRQELGMVVVVARPHAVRDQAVGDLVHEVRRLQPGRFRGGAGGGQTGHDQKLIAERGLKLDRRCQSVAQQRIDAQMRPFADQAVGIEPFADLLRVVAVVACELHAVVAHLGHFLQHIRQILGSLLAHGVEL